MGEGWYVCIRCTKVTGKRDSMNCSVGKRANQDKG